jgi:hypothetical protein
MSTSEPLATEAAVEPHETEFAQQFGFGSYTEMIGESQPVAAASRVLWYLTPLSGGRCLAWTVNALGRARLFASFEDALRHVHDA